MNVTSFKSFCRFLLVTLLVVAVPTDILAQKGESRNVERPFAYLVCNEEGFRNVRAYRVDLLAGEISGVSEPISWIGNPSVVAYNPPHSLLYIGSWRGKSWDYWPITVLRARGGEFEILDRFTNDPRDGGLPRGSQRTYLEKDGSEIRSILNRYLNEVYFLNVSLDGSEVFVSHGGLVDTPYLTEVLDPIEGHVLRRIKSAVPNSTYSWEWSPNGSKVASFYAGKSRTSDARGETWVNDVGTGEEVTRRDVPGNRGLHPPWGRIDKPILVDDGKFAASEAAYALDRDTGELLSELNLRELMGMEDAVSVEPNNVWSALNNNFLRGKRARLAISVTAIAEDPSGAHEHGIRSGHVLLIDVLESLTRTHTEISLVPLPSASSARVSGVGAQNQEEVVFGDCTPLVVAYE